MKRFMVVAAIALATVAPSMPAHASEVPAHTVSGSYSGTGSIVSGCTFHEVATATGTITPFGASTSLTLDLCIDVTPDPATVTGTYLFTGTTGTVGGAVTGTTQNNHPTIDGLFAYHFDLTVTSATGEFAGATGTMALDGFFGLGGLTITGTASGTLYYGTPIATIRQDCAGNGWRTLTDANGQPFRNIGQCIAFASR
jgi:hypothetical protein